ncbi:MAG: hypothetical protein OEW21_11015 [Betaproteobacteria bacterium]|nr:hypothetical protein [Betaproteobacteria bacterium]
MNGDVDERGVVTATRIGIPALEAQGWQKIPGYDVPQRNAGRRIREE